MLLVFLVLIVLVVLTGWMMRHAILAAKNEEELRCTLSLVDIPAFQNLVSEEDDLFLKTVLPVKQYRTAKRARTRGVQQYLLWIANDCSVFQALLRLAQHDRGPSERDQEVSRMCFRLRTTSLALWVYLWLQRIFPQLNFTPATVWRQYQQLSTYIRVYVASRPVNTLSEA